MIYPALDPIDWLSLVGGDANTTAQMAARERKLAAAAKLPTTVMALADRLARQSACFESNPVLLAAEPGAVRWYLDLAGITSKLVPKLRPGWTAAGMRLSPQTLADRRSTGAEAKPSELAAFSRWINDVLLDLYPGDAQSPELALCTVLAMNGARIDGQVRNSAGDDAVLILKRLLTTAFSARQLETEVAASDREPWTTWEPECDLSSRSLLRVGGRLVCDFGAGGNRPDIRVLLNGVVILVGEVKGRSDLSNVWESWMPQISGHLQTWTAENQAAPRVFFGTIINSEMIEGVTRRGTRHTGLRAFARNGVLSAAYNLTNIVEGQQGAVAAFENLVEQLAAIARA